MSRAGIVLPRLRDMARTALEVEYPPDEDGAVDVYLGPLVSGDPDDAVFIGYDGDPLGDFECVRHTQVWGALGQKARDEEFDVLCCIMNRAGQTDADGVAECFDRLYRIFTLIANSIHAVPSLGLGPPMTPYMTADIRNFGAYMPLMESGDVQPRLSYNVHVRTRM
jgi:hypothetical protein